MQAARVFEAHDQLLIDDRSVITLPDEDRLFVRVKSQANRDLRFSLSYRDVEELLQERGIAVDHVTLWRWVQRYAPELEKRLRRRLKATNDSWRGDETYVRVKGQGRDLYRAVDSTGATLDLLLSAKQDAEAAKRFLSKALGRQNHPEPRVIHTDGHAAYPPAIEGLKTGGVLEES